MSFNLGVTDGFRMVRLRSCNFSIFIIIVLNFRSRTSDTYCEAQRWVLVRRSEVADDKFLKRSTLSNLEGEKMRMWRVMVALSGPD